MGIRVLMYEVDNRQLITTVPFPVGVDRVHKRIVENSVVDVYMKEVIRSESEVAGAPLSWIRLVISKLALNRFYQNLASPISRILVILPGERKEEIAEHFGSILGWGEAQRHEFIERVASSSPALSEGKFAPDTYIVARGAHPDETASRVLTSFATGVLSRYSTSTEEQVPLKDAITIASLLEREGSNFEDMRYISGIIWNRLFNGMRLQIDATLQYAKGSRVDQPWWPSVIPADKRIVSVFNTYTNNGLPPAPIANPSVDAIIAALNPRDTECMFYFHDTDSAFHCSVTYAEHVAGLKHYYGQGR